MAKQQGKLCIDSVWSPNDVTKYRTARTALPRTPRAPHCE